MNSPGHRENILNAHYREIGVGVVPGNPARTDGAGGTYATAFGTVEPAAAAAPVAKKAKKAKRRHGGRAGGRKARASRRAGAKARAAGKGRGRGGRRVKARGPVARIAV
jgi:hypothetical protein